MILFAWGRMKPHRSPLLTSTVLHLGHSSEPLSRTRLRLAQAPLTSKVHPRWPSQALVVAPPTETEKWAATCSTKHHSATQRRERCRLLNSLCVLCSLWGQQGA